MCDTSPCANCREMVMGGNYIYVHGLSSSAAKYTFKKTDALFPEHIVTKRVYDGVDGTVEEIRPQKHLVRHFTSFVPSSRGRTVDGPVDSDTKEWEEANDVDQCDQEQHQRSFSDTENPFVGRCTLCPFKSRFNVQKRHFDGRTWTWWRVVFRTTLAIFRQRVIFRRTVFIVVHGDGRHGPH